MFIWYSYSVKFEYDSKKSKLNKEKHGIFLEEAKQLWLLLGVEYGEAKTLYEPRIMRIGELNGKLYSYTIRGSNTIRLISARCSYKKEETLYYEHTKT